MSKRHYILYTENHSTEPPDTSILGSFTHVSYAKEMVRRMYGDVVWEDDITPHPTYRDYDLTDWRTSITPTFDVAIQEVRPNKVLGYA